MLTETITSKVLLFRDQTVTIGIKFPAAIGAVAAIYPAWVVINSGEYTLSY